MQPAYSLKDQTGPFEETFVTRHLANCTYSMVDEASIPFLGYLPQVSGFEALLIWPLLSQLATVVTYPNSCGDPI